MFRVDMQHLELLPSSVMRVSPASSDTGASEIVLLVDDVRENVEVLHDALDEAGYAVCAANHGLAALQLAAQSQPHIILLNAALSGVDGFEVVRRLKAQPSTSQIPVVLMTAPHETEQVLKAFAVGAVDCVAKPVRVREVIARIQVQLQTARHASQARNALDAFGCATLVVNASSARVVWQTPLARALMQRHFGTCHHLPDEAMVWVRDSARRVGMGVVPPSLTLLNHPSRLILALHEQTGDEEWLVVMRERSDRAVVQDLAEAFKLTSREAEVLYWVAKGKTNRDIGDIFGTSHSTVKKHLEHVFKKLGVETRNAAASIAVSRVRGVLGDGTSIEMIPSAEALLAVRA